MNARPILMHARSIQNLLAGRKTQTRRIVKPQPRLLGVRDGAEHWTIPNRCDGTFVCPYGVTGDLLWVRETFCIGYECERGKFTAIPFPGFEDFRRAFYQATDADKPGEPRRSWKPSIHMPRWASRLTLELTDVRVERVQDISTADIFAEGIPQQISGEARAGFAELWDNTNGIGAWERNDWCWALTFKVHRANVDELLGQREAA